MQIFVKTLTGKTITLEVCHYIPVTEEEIIYWLLLGRAIRHNRKCEGEDPGQGGDSPGPAEADLCWQAARGRQVCALEAFILGNKDQLICCLGPSLITTFRRRAPSTWCSGSLVS